MQKFRTSQTSLSISAVKLIFRVNRDLQGLFRLILDNLVSLINLNNRGSLLSRTMLL